MADQPVGSAPPAGPRAARSPEPLQGHQGRLPFRSRDVGATWEPLRLPYEGSLWFGLGLEPLGRVLMFGMRGHVFRSDDLGDSWHPVETGSDQSLQGAVQLRDGRVVAVGLGGSVLTSRDGGLRFEPGPQRDRTGLASVAEAASGKLLLFGESGARLAHARR